MDKPLPRILAWASISVVVVGVFFLLTRWNEPAKRVPTPTLSTANGRSSDWWSKLTAPSATASPAMSPTVSPTKIGLRTYVIVAGDSVQLIEQKAGAPWGAIYQQNVQTIEATARANGHLSSENGTWIYPGETLLIPGP